MRLVKDVLMHLDQDSWITLIKFLLSRLPQMEAKIRRLVKREDGQLFSTQYLIIKKQIFVLKVKLEYPIWCQEPLIGSVIAGPTDGVRTRSGQTHNLGQWNDKVIYSHIAPVMLLDWWKKWKSLLSPVNSMSYLLETPLFL